MSAAPPQQQHNVSSSTENTTDAQGEGTRHRHRPAWAHTPNFCFFSIKRWMSCDIVPYFGDGPPVQPIISHRPVVGCSRYALSPDTENALNSAMRALAAVKILHQPPLVAILLAVAPKTTGEMVPIRPPWLDLRAFVVYSGIGAPLSTHNPFFRRPR